VIRRANQAGLECSVLGKVGGNQLIMEYEGECVVDVRIDQLETAWRRALPKLVS